MRKILFSFLSVPLSLLPRRWPRSGTRCMVRADLSMDAEGNPLPIWRRRRTATPLHPSSWPSRCWASADSTGSTVRLPYSCYQPCSWQGNQSCLNAIIPRSLAHIVRKAFFIDTGCASFSIVPFQSTLKPQVQSLAGPNAWLLHSMLE
jgi:hypothetical protein